MRQEVAATRFPTSGLWLQGEQSWESNRQHVVLVCLPIGKASCVSSATEEEEGEVKESVPIDARHWEPRQEENREKQEKDIFLPVLQEGGGPRRRLLP